VDIKRRQGEKEDPEIVDGIGGEGVEFEDGVDAGNLDDQELQPHADEEG